MLPSINYLVPNHRCNWMLPYPIAKVQHDSNPLPLELYFSITIANINPLLAGQCFNRRRRMSWTPTLVLHCSRRRETNWARMKSSDICKTSRSRHSSQLSALGSQLSALSSQLSALSSQLSALSSQLSAFSFQLSALAKIFLNRNWNVACLN